MAASPFSVHTFVTKVKSAGFASTSRYQVFIARSTLTRAGTINNNAASMNTKANDITLNCENIDLPGISVTTFDRRYYGVSRKLPYGLLYGQTTGSFYLDDNYSERKFFEEWVGQVVNKTNFNISYYDDIVSTITIVGYNLNGTENLRVNLLEAYPIQISNVNFGYSNESMINKVAVEFAYKQYDFNDPSKIYRTELPPPIGF